jgi:2'-5' RNA ligase
MRLFVAIDLNDEVRNAIAAEQKRIATVLGDTDRSSLKWVQPAHMHLTLVFLGEVAEEAVPPVVSAISAEVEVRPFAVGFERLGVFPPHGAPRVLWLGVGDGASQVADVQRHVAHRLAGAGVALERRPFHPHVTLGRWRNSRPQDGRRIREAERDTVVARLSVDGVTLYQSRLGPTGPTHTALARATLT